MSLLKSFGSRLKPSFFERALRSSESTRLTEKLVPAVKGDLVSESCYAAIAFYCSDRRERAWTFATKCLGYAEDYFFGDWRSQVPTDEGTLDPTWWRRVMPWVDRFRYSVCCAMVLGKPEIAKRMAEYPARDSWAKNLGEREAFYGLACFLRGDTKEISRAIELAETSTSEKARHVAEVLRALVARDQDMFQRTFEGYLAFFRRSEFNPNRITQLLCLDGTSFAHLGKLNGLDVEIPSELRDRIIRTDCHTK